MTRELQERIEETRLRAWKAANLRGQKFVDNLTSAEYVSLFDPKQGGLVPFEEVLFDRIKLQEDTAS